jgi:hypothetical protein
MNKIEITFFTIVIMILAVAGFVFRQQLFPAVKVTQKYSAVFLDNGQVYFGHLNGDKLTNVYYLQTNASGTPALIHLGSELHAPTDEMDFTLSHILFTETLQDTGVVVKSITNNK